MKRTFPPISLIFAAMTVWSGYSSAADTAVQNLRVRGRERVVVTTGIVHLGDLADIASLTQGQDEAVIGLKKLYIEKSPAPGEAMNLAANDVLERMRKGGVDLKTVGYILPRSMEVKRASRSISEQELRSAVESYLAAEKREVTVRKVVFPEGFQVFPGDIELEARPERPTNGTMSPFAIKVKSASDETLNLTVNVQIDEWREVPVAAHALTRGAVVEPQDIRMARVNLAALSRDVALGQEDVFGKRLQGDVSAGEYFRSGQMLVPPVIESGAKVTMVYRSGVLEATATGVSLEAGGEGQLIRVRNDNSKKIISGAILGPGLVEVKP